VGFRLRRHQTGEDASQAKGVLAQAGAQQILAGRRGIALVEDEIDDLENRRQADSPVGTVWDLEGDPGLGKRPLVGSDTRNARAISFVVSPPIIRRVRAIRASGDSTGWHAMKISRSRSSSISSASVGSIGGTSPSVRPTSASLRA
jgi:hypothetical protein